MVDIQNHPWVRRLRPRVSYVMPSVQQIDHPVASRRDIDRDIFENLQTLWNGAATDDIVAALLSPEKTQEKVFYALLCKYRTRTLENYNMEGEDDDVKKTKKSPGAPLSFLLLTQLFTDSYLQRKAGNTSSRKARSRLGADGRGSRCRTSPVARSSRSPSPRRR